jgi:hypothetical protein
MSIGVRSQHAAHVDGCALGSLPSSLCLECIAVIAFARPIGLPYPSSRAGHHPFSAEICLQDRTRRGVTCHKDYFAV